MRLPYRCQLWIKVQNQNALLIPKEIRELRLELNITNSHPDNRRVQAVPSHPTYPPSWIQTPSNAYPRLLPLTSHPLTHPRCFSCVYGVVLWRWLGLLTIMSRGLFPPLSGTTSPHHNHQQSLIRDLVLDPYPEAAVTKETLPPYHSPPHACQTDGPVTQCHVTVTK